MIKSIAIWGSVSVIYTGTLAAIILILRETGKVLGEVQTSADVKTAVIIALVVCGIILVAQVVSRAGVKYSFPVERYIITNGLAPRGVTRLNPGSRETGDFLMEMATLSTEHMCGRQLNGNVEIEIKAEPTIDTEARFALEYLRGNNGKYGVTIK